MNASSFVLTLAEDIVPPRDRRGLGAAHRILYVLAGDLVVAGDGSSVPLAADGVWHGDGPCEAVAGAAGATVLRWELTRAGAPTLVGAGTRVLLAQPMELDPAAGWLMRCDRVDFGPGDVALPHRHRGGGIRCLVAGALDVTVGETPPRTMRPGDAWFESGREPVLAVSAKNAPTSFLRVSILPREIQGRSSILYVDPADAARGRPRRYTVHVDAPIALG